MQAWTNSQTTCESTWYYKIYHHKVLEMSQVEQWCCGKDEISLAPAV